MQLVHLVASEKLGWRAVTMAIDQPAFDIGPPEVDQCEAEVLDTPEAPDLEHVLLERPDEPLGAAVAMNG